MKLLNTRGVGEQITHQIKRLKYLKSTNDKNKIRLYDEMNYIFTEKWDLRPFAEPNDWILPCEFCGIITDRNWGYDFGFYVCLGCSIKCECEEYEATR